MGPQELVARLGEVQVLDVRYPNEWEAGRIEGALHIPVDDVADRVDELERGRPVVTVCRSGNRSSTAADLLRGEGFDVDVLEGGMQAWVGAGLPLAAAGGGPGTVAEPQPPADDRPEEHQRLQEGMLDVLFALKERFGDREPGEDEVRGFLRERLISEGRTPEEADAFLEEMGPGRS